MLNRNTQPLEPFAPLHHPPVLVFFTDWAAI
ncbi:hypothetical protein ACSSVY_000866 [Roseovarius sp. MBR-51]